METIHYAVWTSDDSSRGRVYAFTRMDDARQHCLVVEAEDHGDMGKCEDI